MARILSFPVCTRNRDFLDRSQANLYMLLHAFREQLVDTTFEQDGTAYRISSVELGDDSIIATGWPVAINSVHSPRPTSPVEKESEQ